MSQITQFQVFCLKNVKWEGIGHSPPTHPLRHFTPRFARSALHTLPWTPFSKPWIRPCDAHTTCTLNVHIEYASCVTYLHLCEKLFGYYDDHQVASQSLLQCHSRDATIQIYYYNWPQMLRKTAILELNTVTD